MTTSRRARGRNVCVLGYDVAEALFPNGSALDRTVDDRRRPFRVIGVYAKQGHVPRPVQLRHPGGHAARRVREDLQSGMRASICVKMKDKNRMAGRASDELTGAMRRVRGQLPGRRTTSPSTSSRRSSSTIDPIKTGIAIAGLFVTGPGAVRRRRSAS